MLISRSQCTGNRSLYLVYFVFAIQITWWYSHCTCICRHKLWKDRSKIPPRGLRDLLWIGKQSLHAEEFYYVRVKWSYRCLEMSWWILVQIDWTKTEGRTSENWEGNKERCWHVAQLLDGKTSHRDANTVPYFSPIRWETKKRAKYAHTRVEGIARNFLTSRSLRVSRVRACFALRALHVRSQPMEEQVKTCNT